MVELGVIKIFAKRATFLDLSGTCAGSYCSITHLALCYFRRLEMRMAERLLFQISMLTTPVKSPSFDVLS